MSQDKRYYWMKFQRDFFKSLRIKKLRRLAGGDTYTIIYLKLQLLSITEEGYLQYKHVFDTFAEELAEDIDEDVDNVSITLQYLLSTGLMEEQDNDLFFLPYAAENIGSECASAERMRNLRKREKASLCDAGVTQQLRTSDVEKEIDIEIEKDKEIEIDKEIDKVVKPKGSIDYQKIVNLYNTVCVSFPQVTTLSEKRKKAIKARLNKFSEADFLKLFEKAESSDFLKGNNNRNWSATFDWLINDTNMAKVLDGNYDNRSKQAKGIDWEKI